jgi:hypothetical protein
MLKSKTIDVQVKLQMKQALSYRSGFNVKEYTAAFGLYKVSTLVPIAACALTSGAEMLAVNKE